MYLAFLELISLFFVCCTHTAGEVLAMSFFHFLFEQVKNRVIILGFVVKITVKQQKHNPTQLTLR